MHGNATERPSSKQVCFRINICSIHDGTPLWMHPSSHRHAQTHVASYSLSASRHSYVTRQPVVATFRCNFGYRNIRNASFHPKNWISRTFDYLPKGEYLSEIAAFNVDENELRIRGFRYVYHIARVSYSTCFSDVSSTRPLVLGIFECFKLRFTLRFCWLKVCSCFYCAQFPNVAQW